MNRVNRRDFLKIAGAGGVSLTLGSCGREERKTLYSHLMPRDDIVPGIPQWYPTVCRECPAGCGMLAKNREGRTVKLEGNPSHPVNRGALCARGQAALQGLYHPDRIRGPFRRGPNGQVAPISWEEAIEAVTAPLREALDGGNSNSVACLGPLEGNTLDHLMREWFRAIGSVRLHAWEPFDHAPILEASEITWGLRDIPEYDLSRAKTLLSFGADFLDTWLSPVAFSRMFAERHDSVNGTGGRFVHFGPRRSLTAASADRFVAIRPGEEIDLMLGLIHRILSEGGERDLPPAIARRLADLSRPYRAEELAGRLGLEPRFLDDLAREFLDGPSVALAGGIELAHGRATQASVAAHLLNHVAGNMGKTVTFRETSTTPSNRCRPS